MLTFDEVTTRRGVEFANDEEREAVRVRFEILTRAVGAQSQCLER